MRKRLLTTCTVMLLLMTGCSARSKGPAMLYGTGDDGAIAVEAMARLQPDGTYKGTVTVRNKGEQNVGLRYTCASQLWWQGLKPPPPPPKGEQHACPAIYSSGLEVGRTIDFPLSLGPGAVADWNALSVSVKYDVPQGNPRPTSTVTASLRPNP